MAISYYTGIPRSGKTVKAVNLLYYTFVEEKKSIFDKFSKKEKELKYLNSYTNINQFNFQISPKIIKLDFDFLVTQLTQLHIMYMNKADDFELIEKAKEFNIYKTLFVIDECHNYFKGKDNPVLTWWLTYHGHLHQDIILITQDLKLVNDEYKRVAEFFYKAIPQRLRLSKNTFKYRQFSSFNMYQKDYIGTDSIKAENKIFSLYVSGATVNTFPIIYKYLIAFAFLVISLIILYSNFLGGFASEKEENINNLEKTPATLAPESTNTNLINPINPIIDYESLQLYKFECYKDTCYFKNEIEIPVNFLEIFLKDIDSKFINYKATKTRFLIYVLESETKFNFLTKGKLKNEKNKTDNSSTNSSK